MITKTVGANLHLRDRSPIHDCHGRSEKSSGYATELPSFFPRIVALGVAAVNEPAVWLDAVAVALDDDLAFESRYAVVVDVPVPAQ